MRNNTNPWFPIPLIHEGDSYILTCTPASDQVKLAQIVCYRNNQNVEGEEKTFYDLDEATRHAIVRVVRRRHPGMTIIIP
jgi:hypothetical protein